MSSYMPLASGILVVSSLVYTEAKYLLNSSAMFAFCVYDCPELFDSGPILALNLVLLRTYA